jgi:hypothetical protein
MAEKASSFIITDYLHHKQVVNLVEGTNTRVICYSEPESEDESYDSQTYFITNNFLEVASEIASEVKLKHLNQVPCTKVFLHTAQDGYLTKYKEFLEDFNLSIKV